MADLAVSSAPTSDAASGGTEGSERTRGLKGRVGVLEYVGIGLLAFVAMLASQPGVVTDDTKTYLYLDPGRYVRQAVSLWNPNVALGTVTHQNIGYLLPMGPFYWALAELHVPIWIAQRLWMGILLFAAGAGVLYLCRTVGLSGPGRFIASFGFMFTPYVLQYAGRLSVLLMPWSGLPWMIAFVILAIRRGGWRYPALFALVVALVSGINASSILYVGIGPALWIPFSVLILRDSTWRKGWGVAWKIGLLSALVSLWWAVGLQVEAAYGVNVLKYSETVQATSSSSSPFEVLRGLGYWFFYGGSQQGQNWTQSAVAYTQNLWLIAATFAVPTLAFLAAALVRWRLRVYFALLIIVGTILAVGPYPYSAPTGASALIKAFMVDTTAGLALRSTDRASPLVLLGMAMLLGAGVTAIYRRMTRAGLLVGVFAAAAIAGASAPLWTGATVDNTRTQSASPPEYVMQAAKHLNSVHPGTRVYALPGNNFAAYRWGTTYDTVYPGILTRPFVTHEQQTMGSLPTSDLLTAADSPLIDDVADTKTIGPIAALMSAGDVLIQYDQAWESNDMPNPLALAQAFSTTPAGLSDPISYGSPRPNVSTVPHLDERTLSIPNKEKPTAPLVSYTVTNPRPVVRSESLQSPLVIDGSAPGLVSTSSVGLFSGNPAIFYAGTLDGNRSLQHRVLAGTPRLVVTDSNRKQGYLWNGISYNAGYTETTSETSDASNLANSPLNYFSHAPTDAQSTTVFNGIKSVTASSYGSPYGNFVDDRPAAAVDGNPQTAWLVTGGFFDEALQITLDQPKTIDTINLVQSLTPNPGITIAKVTLEFDLRHPVDVTLGPASLTAAGQTIRFPARTATSLRIMIDRLTRHPANIVKVGTLNAIGFAEVRIPGVSAQETVSMPQDLLRTVGPASLSDPLTLMMTRLRSSGYPPRSDPETTLSRTFWLPTARTFSLIGQARISPLASDQTISQLTGQTGFGSPVAVATSSTRLTGNIQAGASSAIDGNPATAWQSGLGKGQQVGQWIQYDTAAPVVFNTLDLKIVSDQQHSIPTAVTVTAGGRSEEVTLPAIASSRISGAVTDVPIALPEALTGQTIRLTIAAANLKYTTNYYSQSPQSLPVGIAELGIPALSARPVQAQLPTTCRGDLVSVDGAPLWISVTGSTATALARGSLTVSLCGPDATGLTLSAGDHTIRSTLGQDVGFDIDQLALSSSAGGGPDPILPGGDFAVQAPPPAPATRVVSEHATSAQLTIAGVTRGTAPFVLVMGQSINPGWAATVNGRSLGSPVLVDGFANGWTIAPATLGSALRGNQLDVQLRFTPQRGVNLALLVSALSSRRVPRARMPARAPAPASFEESGTAGRARRIPKTRRSHR